MARATAEEGAARQAAVKEKQLSEMRRARKEADDQHQAMLNRISFLRSEEAKLDRDIDAAKRRALDLLSRKAEKAEKAHDSDLASTAKDIIEAVAPSLGAPGKPGLRPTTGRSSLRSSIAASLAPGPLTSATLPQGALTADPSAPSTSAPASLAVGSGGGAARPSTPSLRSSSAQRARRPSASGQPLRPTKPSLSSPSSLNAKRPPSSPDPSASGAPASTPAASSKPPLPHTSIGTPPRPSSKDTPGASDRPPRPKGASPAKALPATISGDESLPTSGRVASSSDAAMQQLHPGQGGSGSEAAGHLTRGQAQPSQQQQQGAPGRLNRMDTLGSAGSGQGHADDDPDPDLIEELIAGTATATSCAPGAQPQLQGLHQFSNEGGPARVVHIKTAKAKTQPLPAPGPDAGGSAVVVAAGVGWGLGAGPSGGSGTAGAGAGAVDAGEQARLQQELARKRQLRGVRKAFGLQPTPLQDSSAQVVECGAGSWQ